MGADELVGAHLETLAAMYEQAAPTDPEELGPTPRGLVLSVSGTAPVHLAMRPLVRGLSRGLRPIWKGLTFDHGGNSGTNRYLGGRALRFRSERAPSKLDDRPALVLTYEKALWPMSSLRDELRTIMPGVAIGPIFIGDTVVAWMALAKE